MSPEEFRKLKKGDAVQYKGRAWTVEHCGPSSYRPELYLLTMSKSAHLYDFQAREIERGEPLERSEFAAVSVREPQRSVPPHDADCDCDACDWWRGGDQ